MTVSVLMFCKLIGYVVRYRDEILKISDIGGEMCGKERLLRGSGNIKRSSGY